ncbi:MazG nucleotide pyrophosphohydrolase domain-containing protein [Paenibacillus senegalensis]|uniref:MazG nucleotide pyrophosphohydrolase domain-containing protein n=1 Tax=Paenibacillus senegalensis TaxID=1465766 RepID=UPI000288EDBD|nr:MazG nucleotide pyrophosphohydrolase domain-containing protein [Paenibacillus senegalensis]
MDKPITLQALQDYIRRTDHNPDNKHAYFLKLVEEVGELSEVLRKDKRLEPGGTIKGTIEEELYDVLYYVVGLANVHGIDLEQCFHLKEEINQVKWSKPGI